MIWSRKLSYISDGQMPWHKLDSFSDSEDNNLHNGSLCFIHYLEPKFLLCPIFYKVMDSLLHLEKKIRIFTRSITSYHKQLTLSYIQHICSRQLLKKLMQKGKFIIMSNFSFCHNVFNIILVIILSFIEILPILSKYSCRFVVCGKGLIL